MLVVAVAVAAVVAAVTEPDPWCTIAEFGNALTAQMARGRLAAEDIEAILLGENFMWGYSHAVGSVRLQVRQSQRDAALAVLQELDRGAYSIVEE